MRRNLSLLAGLAALAAFAGACASDAPTSGGAGGGRAADDPPAASDAGRISIPAPVVAQLDAWIAHDTTLLGEVVEIDATRVPFSEGQIGIEASRDTDEKGRRLVERTETTDTATRTVTVTLVNRSGMKTVRSLLPTVRLGGARTFVATDRLILRYVPSPGADRPVVFTALASGNARLLDAEPPRRVAGSAIRISAEILRGADGYAFRPSEESKP